MTQTIKPNDLVYVPSKTKKVCTVKPNKKDCFIVEDGEIINHINTEGYLYDFSLGKWIEQPFAFLATPEMKEKLEQVYGKLEDIPVDEEFIAFDAKLAKLQSILHKIYTKNRDDLDDEAETVHQELLQMFKERGSK